MKKGKRNLVFQTKGGVVSINAYELEKKLYQELKVNGVTFDNDINYYINLDELKAYCVVNETTTITINLNELE